MAESRGDRPMHELLITGEPEKISDLERGTVGPLGIIRALLEIAGEDERGRPLLPATQAIYNSLLALPTSVHAKRADLVAQAMAAEHWRPRRSGDEWDPDHQLYGNGQAKQDRRAPRGLED